MAINDIDKKRTVMIAGRPMDRITAIASGLYTGPDITDSDRYQAAKLKESWGTPFARATEPLPKISSVAPGTREDAYKMAAAQKTSAQSGVRQPSTQLLSSPTEEYKQAIAANTEPVSTQPPKSITLPPPAQPLGVIVPQPAPPPAPPRGPIIQPQAAPAMGPVPEMSAYEQRLLDMKKDIDVGRLGAYATEGGRVIGAAGQRTGAVRPNVQVVEIDDGRYAGMSPEGRAKAMSGDIQVNNTANRIMEDAKKQGQPVSATEAYNQALRELSNPMRDFLSRPQGPSADEMNKRAKASTRYKSGTSSEERAAAEELAKEERQFNREMALKEKEIEGITAGRKEAADIQAEAIREQTDRLVRMKEEDREIEIVQNANLYSTAAGQRGKEFYETKQRLDVASATKDTEAIDAAMKTIGPQTKSAIMTAYGSEDKEIAGRIDAISDTLKSNPANYYQFTEQVDKLLRSLPQGWFTGNARKEMIEDFITATENAIKANAAARVKK